jgi:hypothetical protein
LTQEIFNNPLRFALHSAKKISLCVAPVIFFLPACAALDNFFSLHLAFHQNLTFTALKYALYWDYPKTKLKSI